MNWLRLEFNPSSTLIHYTASLVTSAFPRSTPPSLHFWRPGSGTAEARLSHTQTGNPLRNFTKKKESWICNPSLLLRFKREYPFQRQIPFILFNIIDTISQKVVMLISEKYCFWLGTSLIFLTGGEIEFMEALLTKK